jgi:hypothetical protein
VRSSAAGDRLRGQFFDGRGLFDGHELIDGRREGGRGWR